MSDQKQAVMVDIVPPKPRKPRVITDPRKSEWVVRATNAERELHDVVIQRDNAVAAMRDAVNRMNDMERHAMTTTRMVALVAMFAALAFVAGVVTGWAVFT